MLQKWDARVHLTRDLKHMNAHDELYQITLLKTSKNVIFEKCHAPFFYPQIGKKWKMKKKVTKQGFVQIFKELKIIPMRF